MPRLLFCLIRISALMALFWKLIAVKPFSTQRCVTVSRLNTPVKNPVCTTCHCIVREGFDSLPESSEQEDDMLDKAWGLEPESRLSCRRRASPTKI